MHISGSGSISAGDYKEKISISGSGRINGDLRCLALSCSGSVRGAGNIECEEGVHISGSGRFDKALKAAQLSVNGSASVDGSCEIGGTLAISGSLKCGNTVKCNTFNVSGAAAVAEGVEAETAKISGKLDVEGLLNAETVEFGLAFNSESHIGSIGCSTIRVYLEKNVNWGSFFSLFRKNAVPGVLHVKEAIEGDDLDLDCVSCPKVIGRTVKIGSSCKIGLVQYSETVELDPDAEVGRCEKV